MKRFISIVLAAMLLVSLTVLTTFAEDMIQSPASNTAEIFASYPISETVYQRPASEEETITEPAAEPETPSTPVVLKNQKIKVGKYKSVYKRKDLKKRSRSFRLKVSRLGGASLSYKSSSKWLKVTRTGKVTLRKGSPKKKYRITITAKDTKTYKKGVKTVVLTVK